MNISDIEVREIQAAAANVLPKAIVNIGGVTVGCPCEDEPKCTDQVWVVASSPTQTRGLLFSRINGQWDLGPVQKWRLEYVDLEAHPANFSKYSEFLATESQLVERMPACTGAN